jgi:hypothetical protein
LIVQNQIDRVGGAGIALDWQLSNTWALRSLYAAADGNNPQEGGLFGDRNQASVELEYAMSPAGSVRCNTPAPPSMTPRSKPLD